MSKTGPWSDYLRWLFLALSCGIVCIVGLVALVDPYGLYNIINIQGFNAVKPQVSSHVNEIKLTHAVKLNPETIILGNSRAEVGLNPESPMLTQKLGNSAYNLAVRGTAIKNSREQMEYLISKGIKPKTILLGIEFIDFMQKSNNAPVNAIQPSPLDHRFAVDKWQWRFDSLFSLDAVKDSIRTLSIQSNEEAPILTSRGFNPLREYRSLAREKGYFALFQQKAMDNSKTFFNKAAGSMAMAGFHELQTIIELAAESNSNIYLIIYWG